MEGQKDGRQSCHTTFGTLCRPPSTHDPCADLSSSRNKTSTGTYVGGGVFSEGGQCVLFK